MISLAGTAVAAAAYTAGFRDSALVIAIAIARAESSWIQDNTHINSDGSTDRGLWQINSIHIQYDPTRLLSDPVYNAQAAWDLSGHGTNWGAWSTFNSGVYQQYLGVSQQQANLYLTSINQPLTPFQTTLPPPPSAAPQTATGVGDIVVTPPAVIYRQANHAGAYYASNSYASKAQPGKVMRYLNPGLTNIGTAPGFGFSGTQDAGTVNFLWNPTDISISYQNNTSLLPASQMPPDQTSSSIPNTNSTVTASFILRFDRTFEVNDNSVPEGVLNDIRAFESLVGVGDNTPFLQYIPLIFVFGGQNQSLFRYVGWVTSMNVFYISFSQNMVPTRCDLSLTVLKIATTDAATSLVGSPTASVVTAPNTVNPAASTAPTVAQTINPAVSSFLGGQ